MPQKLPCDPAQRAAISALEWIQQCVVCGGSGYSSVAACNVRGPKGVWSGQLGELSAASSQARDAIVTLAEHCSSQRRSGSFGHGFFKFLTTELSPT
jgi:hypothetical protein